MLYVSTRNPANTYTAHRAIYEVNPPEGGSYAPFHLPKFSQEELAAIRSGSCSEAVTRILNLFFSLRLSADDVENVIGRAPFQLTEMPHKLMIAEGFRNPAASCRFLIKGLYNLMTEGKSEGKLPAGWPYIGIQIALLFGVFTGVQDLDRAFDVAVSTDDYAELTAVCYARDMGLPIQRIVCTSVEDSRLWDLLNRGECSANSNDYLENFLYYTFGSNGENLIKMDEQQQVFLNEKFFAAVVSADRTASVISSMYRANGYMLSSDAALAYGGLQDYRSATGVSNDTLILAKVRPEPVKE